LLDLEENRQQQKNKRKQKNDRTGEKDEKHVGGNGTEGG
jgi:hypothetical protein